jgi:hypothetical protein
MTDSNTTITLPKDVLQAIQTASGEFVACARAGITGDGTLDTPTVEPPVLKFGENQKTYTIDEVNKFAIVDSVLKMDNAVVPEPIEPAESAILGGGSGIRCEKCARKTRSRKQKRAGRRLRKSVKK